MDQLTNGANALQPQENQSLATVQPTINLPIIANHDDLIEAIQTNSADGEKLRFDRISVPAAGSLSFTVINENNQETAITSFRGVILGFQNYCIWFLKKYNEKQEGEDPVFCFSADRVIGSGCPEGNIPSGQKCAECKLKQWGSDRDGGEGTDCHDRCAVWIAKENEAMPILLDLPRTSLSSFRDYRQFLIKKIGQPIHGVVTEISLESIQGKKSKYSAVKFTRGVSLAPTEKTIMRELINDLKNDMVVDFTTMKQLAATAKDDQFDKVADSLQTDASGKTEQLY
jgi:hypothetical protein